MFRVARVLTHEMVAQQTTQVKPAIGNSGKFDPKSPSTTASKIAMDRPSRNAHYFIQWLVRKGIPYDGSVRPFHSSSVAVMLPDGDLEVTFDRTQPEAGVETIYVGPGGETPIAARRIIQQRIKEAKKQGIVWDKEKEEWVTSEEAARTCPDWEGTGVDPFTETAPKTAANIENGYDSWQDAVVDNPKFQAWFKGSKVTDSHGRPLRVFHGTFSSFDKFDTDKGTSERAAFFTPDPEIASSFADAEEFGLDPEEANGNVMPVYLCLKNPMVVKAEDVMSDGIHSFDAMREVVNEARRQGYDGLHILDVPDGNKRSDQFAAFRPNQIKSAIGNSGEFNPKKRNITAADEIEIQEYRITAEESSFEGTTAPGMRIEAHLDGGTVAALEIYFDRS